jgi:hypothetical protein
MDRNFARSPAIRSVALARGGTDQLMGWGDFQTRLAHYRNQHTPESSLSIPSLDVSASADTITGMEAIRC